MNYPAVTDERTARTMTDSEVDSEFERFMEQASNNVLRVCSFCNKY